MFKKITLGLLIAAFGSSIAFAEEPTKTEEKAPMMKCEMTKDGKSETKEVKTEEECTKMGGKVVKEEKKDAEKKAE